MSLHEWYGEREILVTGVTSQIGRNLLSKLLRSFPNVKVHCVLRTREGLSKDDRIKKKIFDSPGFERLHQERPDAVSRVKAYEGNLVYDQLGLPDYNQRALANVSVVFHAGGNCQALLKFCNLLPNLCAVVVVDELFRCKKDQVIESLMDHDEFPMNLRLGIVRLPPVAPALREPMPGYIERLKAPTAVMVGAGHVLGRSDLPAELIPMDIATNTLIVAAWDVGQRKMFDEPLVYNASTIDCTWGDIINKGARASSKYRYPSFRIRGMTSLGILHWFMVVFFEFLPSYTIDTFFYLFDREERLMKEYNRIRDLLKDFESVTLRTTSVARRRVRELTSKRLSQRELDEFPLEPEPIDLESYILCAAAATRKFVVSDRNLTIVRFFMPAMLLLVLMGFYYKFFFRQ